MPFTKNGKVIPNAFLFCDKCHEEETEGYDQAKAADFDYPMSDTFRALSFEQCGQPDPGEIPIKPPRPEPLPPILPEHQLMRKLQEVEGIANYAIENIQTHVSSKKKGWFGKWA